MKFWTDGQENSTRLRNVNFTWERLKDFNNFLKDNEIISDTKLYDFSPEKIIEDSIHIPYELGSYKKAEKTNKILELNDDYDFMFMFDCDAFFMKENYNQLLKLIDNLEYGDFITFDLAKLGEQESNQVITNQHMNLDFDWSYAYSGPKINGPLCCGHRGSLGGVYLSDIKLLINSGKFSETFVGWGGEDGDMIDKIHSSKNKFRQISVRDFAPIHLSHFSDWGNEKYSKRFI